MKKILALALALIMVLGLATTVSADTVDVSDHEFKAYQIFSGSQATDGGALGDVQWGTGVDGDAMMEDLAANTTFTGCADAAAVAAKLANYDGTSDVAKKFARIAYANKMGEGTVVKDGDTIDPGYYLIVDTTNVSGADDVLNLALLEVSSKVTIESKVEKPSSQKKVKDTNDTTGETTDWQDSADYDVDDEVPFQLKATLPGDVTSYNKYYLAFHDVQSAGLDFNADSVEVFVDGKQITSGYEVVTDPEDDCTFEIVIQDVRTTAVGAGNSSVITVEYTSTLNSDAVIGATGNPNEMHIEYSNNPNQIWNGEGKPETGKTPDDKVIAFTYKVVVNKIDKDENPLAGAGFTLYKKNAAGEYTAVGQELKGDTMTTFTWERLDDGDYKLVETTTPKGYNTITPIEFTITADHDDTWEAQAQTEVLNTLTGGDLFTGEVSTGALTEDVVNQAGATLPETGGMGTTLFYAIGGLLVAAAVVLLVTKKRMASAE